MDTTTGQVGTDVPRGTRLATLGLLMAAAGPLLLLVATLAWDLDTDDVGFFAIAAVVALVGAYLISRPQTGAKIAGVIAAVLVGGALFWTAFGLAAPDSFFDFVPGLLLLPGALLGLVAGITSIRSRKQGRPVGAGERKAVLAVPAVVALLAAVSGVLTLTGKETVDDDDAEAADLTVDLKDFEFDQASYDAAGGTTVLVKNSDPFVHTFTVDELDIDVALSPGSEKLVEIPAEPGTYVLYCEPHTSDADDPSDDDMASELTVD